MGNYLKLFKTEADYDAESNKPTVSHIIEAVDVKIESSIHDYSKDYLTLVAVEETTFSFSKACSYSLDGGRTWTSLAATTQTPRIQEGEKVMFKNVSTPAYNGGCGSFYSTSFFNAEGNPLSMIYGDDFKEVNQLPPNAFFRLFFNTKIKSAKNLIIVGDNLPSNCCHTMFSNCESLVEAPKLPATTLSGESCYYYMFENCKSLVEAPELPATTLSYQCYSGMFKSCGLVNAPSLPATELTQACYSYMFAWCKSLVNPPELLAKYGITQCYKGMFRYCQSLVNAPTVEVVDKVSGKSLYESFDSMFQGCTSLERVTIKTKALTTGTLSYMLDGCTNLKYIKALFTTTPSTNNSYYFANGIPSGGTFVKSRSATWNVTASSGNNWVGVPAGWTIEYADE